MPLERRRVLYSGRVQGVGFRATCQWLAGGFDVVGYVRNLPDGRVELLAQGDAAEIDRYLVAISGEMATFIRDIASEPEPTDYPPLDGFKVRF
jgi:acylphosphatase